MQLLQVSTNLVNNQPLTSDLQHSEVLSVLWLQPAALPPILTHSVPAGDQLAAPLGCRQYSTA
jgi:hypothetical protein